MFHCAKKIHQKSISSVITMETGGVRAVALDVHPSSAFSRHHPTGRAKMHFIFFFSIMCLFNSVKSDMRSSGGSASDKNPKIFNIGGVLSNDDSINHFKETIEVKKQLVL